MTKFINYTAHEIVVYDTFTGKVHTSIAPSGMVARVFYRRSYQRTIEGIPIVSLSGSAVWLVSREDFLAGANFPTRILFPEESEDTFYLVSSQVLQLFPWRKDLLAPDTNKAVHDERGRIIGVPGFIENSEEE